MVRRGLTPYIFVINNDGYEIERLSECPASSADHSPRARGQIQ